MRIIDILNDYANGKIKDGFKFRSGNYNWVIEEDGIHSINQYSNYDDMGDYVYFEDCFDLSNLNDEVEIINENKIEKLSYQQIGSYLLERKDYETFTNCVNEQISKIGKKLNDMVEVVNYLLEKEK